jgi:hypothetical protein
VRERGECEGVTTCSNVPRLFEKSIYTITISFSPFLAPAFDIMQLEPKTQDVSRCTHSERDPCLAPFFILNHFFTVPTRESCMAIIPMKKKAKKQGNNNKKTAEERTFTVMFEENITKYLNGRNKTVPWPTKRAASRRNVLRRRQLRKKVVNSGASRHLALHFTQNETKLERGENY